jgi:hypothetical protein
MTDGLDLGPRLERLANELVRDAVTPSPWSSSWPGRGLAR